MLFHIADVAVKVRRWIVKILQEQFRRPLEGLKWTHQICANICFIVIYDCIDIEYDNKINFVWMHITLKQNLRLY